MRNVLDFIVIIGVVILAMAFSFSAFGSGSEARLPPMTKKNKNEVTDFFSNEIEDKKSLEQKVEQYQAAAVKGIEGKAGDSGSPEVRELENMDQTEAEERGYQVRLENNDFLNNTQVNYNDPQIMAHKKDTDKIANASQKLMDKLTEKLEELGIDCRQRKGAKPSEPEMYIEIEQEQQKEVIYDKYLCEYLRNQYSCSDSLKLKCLDFGQVPARFMIIGSTVPYKAASHNNYSVFEFSSTGSFAGPSKRGGGRLRKGISNRVLSSIGFGIAKGSTNTLQASEITINIGFAVDNQIETLSRLEIVDMDYRTVILLKVNDRVVRQAPGGGYRLELAGYHEEVRKGKKKYGGKFGKRVEHVTYYPIVDTGVGSVILGKVNPDNHISSINLLPYVQEGANSIEIKVIGLEQASINFRINAAERICYNWQETWDERCSLN